MICLLLQRVDYIRALKDKKVNKEILDLQVLKVQMAMMAL